MLRPPTSVDRDFDGRAAYLRRFGREMGREVVEIAPAAMDRLREYSWPGNIRVLQQQELSTLGAGQFSAKLAFRRRPPE